MIEQPAGRSYFFGPCYEDRNKVISDAWKDVNALGESLTSKFRYKGDNKFLKAVVGFWGWSARIVYSVTSTILMAVMIVLHNSVLLIGNTSGLLTILILRIVDRLWYTIWKIKHPCPTNYCKDSKPVFLCPKCNARHTDLVPSHYGVFRRVCECGTSIPTLHTLGRKALECICSECEQPLTNVQTADAHIAFVGGPSSGKTNLFFMSLKEMAATYHRAGYSEMLFAEASQKQFVDNQVQSLMHGSPAAKTSETAPKAIHLMFKRALSPVPKSVYYYDVAGEAFDTDQAVAEHAFYDHVDAVVFVIDPLSIPEVSDRFVDAEESIGVSVCKLQPEDAYARMLGALKQYCSRGVDGFKYARLAVVFSKVDLFDLQQEIDGFLKPVDPKKKSDPQSDACRDWLEAQKQANLIRLIESDFRNVKYFAVSALGRIPDMTDHRGFDGIRVLDPILWSLQHKLTWREKA